jgi:hypothetical protein
LDHGVANKKLGYFILLSLKAAVFASVRKENNAIKTNERPMGLFKNGLVAV